MDSKAAIDDFKRQFKAIRPGVTGRFVYFAKGPDGKPLLKVGKRLTSAEVKSIRKDAKDKKFVKGTLEMTDDRKTYTFRVPKTVKRMERDITRYFGRFVPKLKRATFQTDDPTEDEEVEVERSVDDIRASLAGLREALYKAQQAREATEIEIVKLKQQLLETTRDARREGIAKQLAELDGLLKQQTAEENNIREQLGMEQAELQRQHVMGIDTEFEGSLDERAAEVEAQERRAADADRAAEEARDALEKKEARLKDLQARRRSKLIALDRLSPEEAAHAKMVIATLEAEEAALLLEVSQVQARVEDAVLRKLTERARSESMLDLWNEEVAQHWEEVSPEDQLEALEESNAALAEAHVETGRARGALEALEGEHAAARDRLEALQLRLDEDTARTYQLEQLRVVISRQINDADWSTNTQGLTDKLDAIGKELADIKAGLPDVRRDYEAQLELVGELDTGAVDRLRDALRQAQDSEVGARTALNQSMMSEQEQARMANLQVERQRTAEAADTASGELDEAVSREEGLRKQLSAREDARRAMEEAHKLLTLAHMEHSQLSDIAGKIRGLRFFKKDREAIDEARGQLPEAAMKLEAARMAYEQAQKVLAETSVLTDRELQAELEQATADRRQKQEASTELNIKAAEAAQLVADEDACLALLVEDIATRHSGHQYDALLAAADDEVKAAVTEASARKAAARTASTEATMALCDAEADLEDLQAAVTTLAEQLKAGTADPMEMQRKLTELSAARATAVRLREAAEAAALSLADATAESKSAKSALLETLADSDGDLAAQAQELLALRAQKERASERSQQAAVEAAEASERCVAAIEAHDEIRREAAVAEINEELAAIIGSKKDLIDQVHHLGDPTKPETSYSYDLLSKEGCKSAKKKLGRDRYADLQRFQADLESKAAQMIRRGVTFEELSKAFAHIPNGLRPPSYRSEAAAFAKLERAFQDQKDDRAREEADARIMSLATSGMTEDEFRASVGPLLKKMGTTWGEFYKTFNGEWEKSGLKGLTGKAVKAGFSETDADGKSTPTAEGEAMMQIMSIAGVAVHTVGAIKGGVDIYDNIQASKKETDPVKQKLLEDDLFNKINGFMTANMKLGANVTQLGGMLAGTLSSVAPVTAGLTAGVFVKDLAVHYLELSARRAKQKWDTLLNQAASVAGSPLASAFEESMSREWRLIKELGVDIGLDVTRIVATAVSLYPPAAIFGIAAQLAAWAAQKVKEEVAAYYDAKLATKSKQLLDAARSGDDAAKTELFKNHALYAKGLIAYMAYEESDSYALMYTRSRGLKDSDIKKSSMDIITRYLLKQAKQSADPSDLQDYAAKWAARRDTAATLLMYAVPGLGVVKAGLDIHEHFSKIAPALDDAAIAKLEEARAAAHDVLNDRSAVERLRATWADKREASKTDADRTAAEANISALERLLGDYEKLFASTLTYASQQLRLMHELAAQLETYRDVNRDKLARAVRKTLANADAWIKKLQDVESDIITDLARAA